jgi:hypothetical protein
MRSSTHILVVAALVALTVAGCGSSSQQVPASQEAAHVTKVSDKQAASKPTQFVQTARPAKKYPFKVTVVADPQKPSAVTITVTNLTAQPVGPLTVDFIGAADGTGVQPVNVTSSDNQKLSPQLASSSSKAFGKKVLPPQGVYTVHALYPDQIGTICVQANATLINQRDLTPLNGASSC